jgi:hypothetical protein
MKNGITKWQENKITEIGTRQWKFEYLEFGTFPDGLPLLNDVYLLFRRSRLSL